MRFLFFRLRCPRSLYGVFTELEGNAPPWRRCCCDRIVESPRQRMVCGLTKNAPPALASVLTYPVFTSSASRHAVFVSWTNLSESSNALLAPDSIRPTRHGKISRPQAGSCIPHVRFRAFSVSLKAIAKPTISPAMCAPFAIDVPNFSQTNQRLSAIMQK